MSTFANLVDRYRRQGDDPITLEVVANRFDVSRQQLHNYMTGEQRPSSKKLRKIAAVLGLTPKTISRALSQTAEVTS